MLNLGILSLFRDIKHASYSSNGHLISAASLTNGERIVVTYSSSGCFHWFTHTLTFEGGKQLRLVAIDNGHSWFHGERSGQGAESIGATVLSTGERKGWDELMNDYRLRFDRGWSTTTVEIVAEYFRSGSKVGEEKIVTQNSIESLIRDYDERGDDYQERSWRITPDMVSVRMLEQHAQKG